MDKLLAMRSFVAIVDHGSLTAAAEALDRSLPTMVRILATLEDDLGARLRDLPAGESHAEALRIMHKDLHKH